MLWLYLVIMRLIPLLTAAQETHGHLSEPVLRDLARAANVPLHRLQQLVSFYPHFRTTPPPRVELAVCRDVSCHLAGIPKLKELHGGDVEVHEVSCIGRCDRARPGCSTAPRSTSATWTRSGSGWRGSPGVRAAAAAALGPRPVPDAAGPLRRDPQAREDPASAERMVAELKASGLRGMGGAGFPAGTKAELVRKEHRTPKYVICNADESEPGTFKDAKVLADVPHLVIEAMLLACHFVGAATGHPLPAPRVPAGEGPLRGGARPTPRSTASRSRCSSPPAGTSSARRRHCWSAWRTSAASRGTSRRSPAPTASYGQPTLINNVETFANVPGIVLNGADWWQALGTEGCPGPKFIAVSGHVERPGVYQVPLGTTVRELIERAGGVSGGRKLLAFAPGGRVVELAAGGPGRRAARLQRAGEGRLDARLRGAGGRRRGDGPAGGGGERDAVLPQRVVRQVRPVPGRLARRRSSCSNRGKSLDVLPELGEAMALTSICGLGQVAVAPALSVLKHWPELGKS